MPYSIPLSVPDITQHEINAVTEALKSSSLSMGAYVEQFEQACARLTNRREAVAVSSGTAALHCCCHAAGLKEGDEVITTPLSFIATANAIVYTGAKPVFVDINAQTLNLDPAKVEQAITPRTRAIVAAEAFGHAGGMAEIEQIAGRHELILIEDACEGLGGRIGERPIGSFGRASCLSFCPNKQITTGEGGMILTDDGRLAELCRSLRNHGRDGTPWMTYQRLGFNYRMSELAASLGHAQLGRIKTILENRRMAVNTYFQCLIDNHYLILPTIPQDMSMSWFVFLVRLNDLFEPGDRDEVIKGLRSEGIGCNNYFPPIHLQPHVTQLLGTRAGDCPICEYISQRTIALPCYSGMTTAQVERVCEVLDGMMEKVLVGRKGRF